MNNKTLHNTEKETAAKHGSFLSYFTGFVLSLLFTAIPYYLVVEKELDGNILLATIVGFAALQLVIQVVFFLHLGRERKPRWNLFFLVSTIGIVLLVVLSSIWIMSHLHYNMSRTDVVDKVVDDEAVYQIDGEQVGTCPGDTGVNHKVELKNNTVSPRHIDAQLCDTITLTNLDSTTHEIRFGAPEKRETYAGEDGKTIRPGRNKAFPLTELGAHEFYDPTQSQISGYFTVQPKPQGAGEEEIYE